MPEQGTIAGELPEYDAAQAVDTASTSAALNTPVSRQEEPFGKIEELLLDEARARFEFEQKSAGALQSKSAFFLSLVGVFAAFIAASVGRLLEINITSWLDRVALFSLVLSLSILSYVAMLLSRSALARSYEVIATPSSWLAYVTSLRQDGIDMAAAYARVRHDTFAAWIRACDVCYATNEAKARVLDQASTFIGVAIVVAWASVCLLVVRALLT
jgi:hypothetical protein